MAFSQQLPLHLLSHVLFDFRVSARPEGGRQMGCVVPTVPRTQNSLNGSNEPKTGVGGTHGGACSHHARSVSPKISCMSRSTWRSISHCECWRSWEEPGTKGSHVAPGSPRAEGFSWAQPSPFLLPREILASDRSWPDHWPGHTRNAAT